MARWWTQQNGETHWCKLFCKNTFFLHKVQLKDIIVYIKIFSLLYLIQRCVVCVVVFSQNLKIWVENVDIRNLFLMFWLSFAFYKGIEYRGGMDFL